LLDQQLESGGIMRNIKPGKRRLAVLGALATASLLPVSIHAADDAAMLRNELDKLKEDVASLRDAAVRAPYEWDKGTSFHFGGYAAAGYSSQKSGGRSFDQAVFVPGFHFNYRDLIFAEAKFETSVAPDGGTETKIESANLNVFLGDHAALVVGKFLSPLGQFQQNYHAPWINKLASRPAGFGEEASGAPLANVGAQVRGGFPLAAGTKANYALFVANAPRLIEEDDEIELVTNDSGTRPPNNKKIFGGRVSFFPVPLFEIGVSGASGQTALQTDGEAPEAGASRNYRAAGVDLAWQYGKDLDVRGEYLRQRIGAATEDPAGPFALVPSDGSEWSARYLQAAYKILPKWEAVYRYSKFSSAHASQYQRQDAFGINYWAASNVVGKFTYEVNDGQADRLTDQNRVLLQLTYGF
jgi:hypothetical protein